MDLHAFDFVRDEKPPPTVMHISAVRQKLEVPFDHAGDAIRLGGAVAATVSPLDKLDRNARRGSKGKRKA